MTALTLKFISDPKLLIFRFFITLTQSYDLNVEQDSTDYSGCEQPHSTSDSLASRNRNAREPNPLRGRVPALHSGLPSVGIFATCPLLSDAGKGARSLFFSCFRSRTLLSCPFLPDAKIKAFARFSVETKLWASFVN